MGQFRDRLAHAWNAFVEPDRRKEQVEPFSGGYGTYSVRPPDRGSTRRVSNERSIVTAIYNQMAIDATAVSIRHVRNDDNNRYKEDISSGLNECLMVSANLDQAGSAFRLDLFQSILEVGVVAVVPVETSIDPENSDGYDIKSLRVGEIVEWLPDEVRVNLYNEKTGKRQIIKLPKKFVAIIENPKYSVMNQQNSTLQRLIRKLNLLDSVDEAAASGKLDIIVQLPYVVKSDARRTEVERRRTEVEMQLRGSQYGIAYMDSTEKITQLNRPAENNMLKQIQFLTDRLYGELGMSPAIFDGTADETTMLNYDNRAIIPLLTAVVEEFSRKFLSRTARTRKQTIRYFRDPFKRASLSTFAELADKFARNEIMTSNEIRDPMGLAPSSDPRADKLINSNMPQPKEVEAASREVEIEEPIELKQIKS